MTGVAFYIGGLAVGWYGIMIAIGVLSAIGVAFIETKRRGESTKHIINMALLGRKLKNHLRDGDIFFLYVIYYSIGRFFLEGLKLDVWTLGGIPTARWITGLAIVTAIIVMMFRHYKHYQEAR
jgi:prolipoprotein diacylglyceryltransferase